MGAEFHATKFLMENGAGGLALLIILGVGMWRFFQFVRNGRENKESDGNIPQALEQVRVNTIAIAVIQTDLTYLKNGQKEQGDTLKEINHKLDAALLRCQP